MGYFIVETSPFGMGYTIHSDSFFNTLKEAENYVKKRVERGERKDLTIAKVIKEWSFYKNKRIQKI